MPHCTRWRTLIFSHHPSYGVNHGRWTRNTLGLDETQSYAVIVHVVPHTCPVPTRHEPRERGLYLHKGRAVSAQAQ
jgi:hypothetical protein